MEKDGKGDDDVSLRGASSDKGVVQRVGLSLARGICCCFKGAFI